MKPGRDTYDWDAAFVRWVQMGPTRTLADVGREIGCSPRTVKAASKRLGWETRLEAIDRKARDQADSRMVRDRADRIVDTLKVIDGARARFAAQLAHSDFRLTGSDFVGLIKLEALLEGEATERIELGEVRVLMGMMLGIVRVFVEDTTGSVEDRRGKMLELVRDLPLVGPGEKQHAEAA